MFCLEQDGFDLYLSSVTAMAEQKDWKINSVDEFVLFFCAHKRRKILRLVLYNCHPWKQEGRRTWQRMLLLLVVYYGDYDEMYEICIDKEIPRIEGYFRCIVH